MRTNDPLRLPLTIAAAYILLAGLIHLFPSLIEPVFAREVVDPATESLFGAALIGLGAYAALLVSRRHRTSALLWAFVGVFVLVTIDMIAYWAMGQYTARTILAPILINALLALWVASQMPKAELAGTQVTGA